jgi:hypothetical protein
MNAPRSAPRLLVGTFELYRRYPWLFLVLAAAVIVPYELIVLAATGDGTFSGADVSGTVWLFRTLANWVVVTPLVSALHVHAVSEVRHDREPRIGSVAWQGLKVLPVVAAATIVSWLGILAGFLLIVPGVILLLRWAVVAQAAAIEREGWLPALRRSGKLAQGNYIHIALFVFLVGLLAGAPAFIVGHAFFGRHDSGAAPFLSALAIQVVTASFTALAGALLYYDLRLRREAEPQPVAPGPTPRDSVDPRSYSDLDRPKGWYVDPVSPSRMTHWGGREQPEWTGSTRTPRKIRRVWHAENVKGQNGER